MSACSCLLGLTGCASNEHKPNLKTNTDMLLDKSIEEIHNGVQSLANKRSDLNKAPGEKSVNLSILPVELKKKLDVRWYGEASVVLDDIANSLKGMKFSEVGIKPSHVFDVYLDERGTMLIDILRNIGFQLPSNIVLDVAIDPHNKKDFSVELQYK